jgi:hypothetical protein
VLEIATPIPQQSVGKTFVIAISLLGVVAFAEFCMLVAAFVGGAHTNGLAVAEQPKPASTPMQVTLNTDPFAAAAAATPAPTPAPALALAKPQPVDVLPKPAPVAMATPVTVSAPPPAATPMPAPAVEPTPEARVTELVELARALRSRGDTATTLTRLREAQVILPDSPLVLSEFAITYDKMGLADKSAEYWRKVYDIGESAGIYYSAAEAKLKAAEDLAKAKSMPTPAPPAPPAPETTAQDVDGIQPGSVLGLIDLVRTPLQEANAGEKFKLRVPVKARPKSKIDVRDVVIQVFFYDIIDNQNIVATNANVSSRWTTLPADWADDDIEILEVEYAQPKPEKKAAENRKYYGYVVRIYYKTELQDMRADPVKLLKQYPPPLRLQIDETQK